VFSVDPNHYQKEKFENVMNDRQFKQVVNNDDIFTGYDWEAQYNQDKRSRLSQQRFSGVSSTGVMHPNAKGMSGGGMSVLKGANNMVNTSALLQSNDGSGVFK
jgi:hypothetical protein